MAELVSGCGGVTKNEGYLAYFSNLSDAVLDVKPISFVTGEKPYYPPVDLGLIPFTWDDAEEYVQNEAEKELLPPAGDYLVPVGGSILLAANTPIYVQVQADQNATAESRASELLVDYVVDNLKEEVPEDGIISYTTAVSDCVNAGYNAWTALNNEDSETAPDTITTAFATYQQCQDLQAKLKEDPHSELHVVAAVHPVNTGELNQDLSEVADHAEQDGWPKIIDDLISDGGKIVEDLHP